MFWICLNLCVHLGQLFVPLETISFTNHGLEEARRRMKQIPGTDFISFQPPSFTYSKISMFSFVQVPNCCICLFFFSCEATVTVNSKPEIIYRGSKNLAVTDLGLLEMSAVVHFQIGKNSCGMENSYGC